MRKILSLAILLLPLAVFSPTAPSKEPTVRISGLTEPARLVRETPLVKDGRPVSVILHPDTEAGRQAAAAIAAAVRELTGCRLTVRPGSPADARADTTAILIGNVNSNPALSLLYARFFTPVDAICPGQGGSLVHTVFDPFGKKFNAVVVGASDDAGLARAADRLAAVIRGQKKGRSLTLPRIFAADYSAGFRARFPFAGVAPAADRLQTGLRDGQKALDEGKHTSIAGELANAALRYQLNGDAVEAKLYAALWDMYAKSAVDDPSKFGGPWGFDSDFRSMEVVAGWRVVENDPSLTDAERLSVTRSLGRWVSEPVVTSCADPSHSDRVLHNHETFPALGTLFAGLYFTEVCPTGEGPEWLKIADDQFRRQARYFKPQEDCNGYQWLTNGHLFRYAVARPDPTVFENGNAKRMIDYCIGTMDNLGIQVPYGDTGSWKCWDSEMACLNVYAFVTGDPAATWTAARKQAVKDYAALYGYCRDEAGETPQNFDGVRVWPLEPQYVQTFPPETPMPMESLFDKISFRDGFDPAGPYLLLDGLSNGGHKHLDGNSLPRLTQFDRIWLADNDYFKTAVKYHNSIMVFRDGQATPIPAYTRFLGSGENDRFGYSQTRIEDYSGVDWLRTVVWLKRLGAFVVLDRLTAREASDYQFRLLWHGVGAASVSEKGMFLTQKGPSFWIQPAPATRLELKNDAELGANWSDYPHADPFVRSLNATVYRKLAQGESQLFCDRPPRRRGRERGTVGPRKPGEPDRRPPDRRSRENGDRPGTHRAADLLRFVPQRRRPAGPGQRRPQPLFGHQGRPRRLSLTQLPQAGDGRDGGPRQHPGHRRASRRPAGRCAGPSSQDTCSKGGLGKDHRRRRPNARRRVPDHPAGRGLPRRPGPAAFDPRGNDNGRSRGPERRRNGAVGNQRSRQDQRHRRRRPRRRWQG